MFTFFIETLNKTTNMHVFSYDRILKIEYNCMRTGVSIWLYKKDRLEKDRKVRNWIDFQQEMASLFQEGKIIFLSGNTSITAVVMTHHASWWNRKADSASLSNLRVSAPRETKRHRDRLIYSFSRQGVPFFKTSKRFGSVTTRGPRRVASGRHTSEILKLISPGMAYIKGTWVFHGNLHSL
jgi:hypothetical protein